MRAVRAASMMLGSLAVWSAIPSSPAQAEALRSYRFAVVVETSGIPPAVKSRLQDAVEGLIGELRGAECVARDDVRDALADARTETNQKCAAGKLDSRCQVALGKGVDANYVAKLDVQKQGKSCDVRLQVFSIAEETQKASATELGTSCDGDALTKGLRPLVDKVASKLGLGSDGLGPVELPGGSSGAAESDFDRQLKALQARRAQEEATWTALTKELSKLGPAGQRSKLEAYVKLVGPDGPHADEARSKLAAFREDEASNKLGPLRTLLSASGTTLEDKRRLVSSFVTEFGGTRAASEAQALLSTAEEKAAAAQADQEQKSASGRGGVTWIRSARAGVSFTNGELTLAGVSFTKSEVTVAQYEACVRAGPCTDTFDTGGYCNYGSSRGGEHPMNCVDWTGADKFCRWVGGRLPTEDEWYAEASARGKYPWGNEEASCSRAVMKGERNGSCGRDSTWPVCSKPAGNSASGLCDMSGNVWEWTSTQRGAERVLRGGSWRNDAQEGLSAAGRDTGAPSSRGNDLGFRCARPRE